MKVLVLGSAGYIGSIVTQHLLKDYEVRGYDSLKFGGNGLLGVWGNPRFEFVRGDVRDKDRVIEAMEGVDAVVWLVALVGEPACNKNPSETWAINFQSLVDVIEYIGSRKLIFTSTCSNYGVHERDLATEETPLNPISLYSETKARVEQVVGDRGVILRLATAFGVSPRMRFDLLLNEWVKDAVTKNYISVYGASSYRPFVHVRDIARAIEFCLDKPNQVLNVGGENWEKSNLAHSIASGIPLCKVALAEGKEDPRNYLVDFSKLNNLGFECQYPVDRGILEIRQALREGVIVDPFSGAYSNA